MVKIRRVSGESAVTAVTLDEAVDHLATAQKKFDDMIAVRRVKRDKLPRVQWRAFNEDSTEFQLECTDELEVARKAASRLLGSDARGQKVPVGAAVEVSKAGKGGA